MTDNSHSSSKSSLTEKNILKSCENLADLETTVQQYEEIGKILKGDLNFWYIPDVNGPRR